jgi:hypothetical protein
MGKKLVSKTAKVLSETKKSKEKMAVAIAYEHIPRNPEEQAHGSLYAVLEIEDKGGHAEEIAESIIDALHNEYYLDTDREPLASFESALAKINEELAERSSEGQINWIGKLNGVLAVLTGSTIHLTQAGKAEAYLYRGDHAMHITEDLAGDSINPLRTFINIASGDLVENDRMALVTPGAFLKISKNELKRYVIENSPKNAVAALSQLLSNESGGALPNSMLILEMVSPEAFAAEPEPESTSEAWIKEENKPLEEVTTGTLHGAAKAFDYIGKATAAASAFVTAKAIPGIKSAASGITNKAKGFKKDSSAEKVIIESEERLDAHKPQSLEPEEDGILESGSKSNEYSEIRIRESENKPRRLSLERFDFSFATNAKDGFLGFFKKSKNSGLFLVLGLLIVGAIIGGLAYQNNITTKKTAAQNQYNQAEAKYSEAQAALGAGQRAEAIEDLKAAENLAVQAKATSYQKTNAEALLSKIAETKNQALGIVKNTATMYHDFGKGPLDAVYQDGTTIFALKNSDGSVYSLDTKTKTQATVITGAGIPSAIKFSTYVPARKVIVAYTVDKNLYELNLTTKKAIKQTVSGGVADGVSLASYGTSNIYLLSPTNNQIYKYVKSGASYGAKTNYLTTTGAADVTGGVALAIDSSVYVTSAGGTIQKFTSGKQDAYAVKGYPVSYTGISGIFASADVKGQYLFNNDSVIKVDANGQYSAQYTSSEVKALKSIVVYDNVNTIYSLSAGKIYKTSF